MTKNDGTGVSDPTEETENPEIKTFSPSLISLFLAACYPLSKLNIFIHPYKIDLSLFSPDAPLITVPPLDTVTAYGSDVSLTCAAEGPPTPTISWSRRYGAPLGNSSLDLYGTLHLFR